MNSKIVRFVFGFAASVVLLGCAQQVPPRGGDKDLLAPIMLASEPENFTPNFNTNKIELSFNEFIRLKNEQQNIIISPVLKYDPDFLVKGKKLIIEIEDTLEENTTYVINFNDAIVDITEENPLSGYQYVFSTGSYVDSLQLNGRIFDAFSLAPIPDVFVMLYDNLEDSVPYQELPRYITKCNEQGDFTISNIKEGKYRAFALSDINRNYMFDLPKEQIGFYDTIISIGSDTMRNFPEIAIFQEDLDKQFLKKFSSKLHGQFFLRFNRSVDSISFRDLRGNIDRTTLIYDIDAKRDSMIFWFDPPNQIDTINLEITADTIIDTIFLAIPPKNKKVLGMNVTTNITSGKITPNDSLRIMIDRPADLDTSLIKLMEDTLEVPLTWHRSNKTKRAYTTFYPWKEDIPYRLILKEGALTDIYKSTNDSMKVGFKAKELSFYGTLKISMNNMEEGTILQLLLDKTIVDTSITKAGGNSFFYDFLTPGSYGLKLIHDENRNGKWDPGIYLQGQQPERVTIYPGTITIRSNWDQEVEWIIE